MSQRTEKVEELIRQTAARFLQRRLESKPLVTVTRATVSDDLKQGTVFISVMPNDNEDMVLKKARALLSPLRKTLGDNMKTKNTPYLSIEIDTGEKKRQRIDEILRNT